MNLGVAESEYETTILCVGSLRLCVFARDKNHTINQQRLNLVVTHCNRLYTTS